MVELLEALLFSTLSALPALLFASLGATVSERAGVVNVGVEGMMRAGAFAAAAASLVMPTPLGVLCGVAAGAALGGIHAFFAIKLRADQVVSGMALNLVALSLGSFLLEAVFNPSGTPSVEQLGRLNPGFVAEVPLLRALFGHSLLTYLALVLPFALHYLFFRTAFGLRLRAAGEKPAAPATLGVDVNGLRALAVVCSGALAGLGGAALSVGTLDRFEQHMPAGLGFMAVAAMVFGRWTPLGAASAALFFAFASALRIGLGSSAPGITAVVPQGFLLALPYALTLGVLAISGKKARAPAALGQPFHPEAR